MRILHISKFYPPVPGGIENFVFDLANAQIRQGHAVTVLCHQTEAARPTFTQTIHGVTVIRVRTFGQLAYTPVTPEFPLYLRRTVRRFQPDAIHAHLPNVSSFWLLFSSLPCPLILHWHADVVASRIDRKLAFLYQFYKPWETALLHKADAVIATSRAYLDHSAPLRPFYKKCHVVPLGLDPARLTANDSRSDIIAGKESRPAMPDLWETVHRRERIPARKVHRSHFLHDKEHGRNDDQDPGFDSDQRFKPGHSPFTILSVGRFTYYKGFEYLVDAATMQVDVHFIIVGDGPEFDKIKARVRGNHLENRFDLVGKVNSPELIRLLINCDVFCLPSIERTEAFGLVLLEAMHFAKPMITTKIRGSGVLEVNDHGITGLQVPVADAKALCDAILYLKHHPARRHDMGHASREKFNRCFKINPVAERITRIYREI